MFQVKHALIKLNDLIGDRSLGGDVVGTSRNNSLVISTIEDKRSVEDEDGDKKEPEFFAPQEEVVGFVKARRSTQVINYFTILQRISHG